MASLETSTDAENGATESSPLVSEASTAEPAPDARLWDEMNKPWPSTYERSISLLSSPIQPRKNVQEFTKSPKPGRSPMALARRSDLDRGYHSPIPGFGDGRNDSFQMGMQKVQSLDYSKQKAANYLNDVNLDSIADEQERKAMKAKAYRDAILKKQETGKKPKKKKKGGDGHGPPAGDEKATVFQCAFNLFNILMGVGLLGLPYVFKSAGWLGGSLCLLAFSIAAHRTALLIGRELNGDPRPCHMFDDSPYKSPIVPGSSATARMRPPLTSFPDIAREAFGDTGAILLSIVLYFELFSCICVLMVAMGDHLHKLFPSVSFNVHTTVVSAISLFPTVLLRTPALLSYLSLVGSVATVVLCSAVILSYLFEGDMTHPPASSKARVVAAPKPA